MKFLLFSDSAETQFRVRKIVDTEKDSLLTVKNENLFLSLINVCEFDLFLIDLNSNCCFSDLRSRMREVKSEIPWILLSTQSNLSCQNYLNYWKAVNGINGHFTDSSPFLEKKLEKLAETLKQNTCSCLSKKAGKLLAFLIKFQNKSIAIETLEEKVFGEVSLKNRNLLYGLIHEIRLEIGDDLSKPHDLVRFKKGRYKLLNVFPEKSLDVCLYGKAFENESAGIFSAFSSRYGYEFFKPDEDYEYDEQNLFAGEKLDADFSISMIGEALPLYKSDRKNEILRKYFVMEIPDEKKTYSEYRIKEKPEGL